MSTRKIAKLSVVTISILYLTFISHTNAAECSILTSTFCSGNPSCEWNSNTDECYCGITAPLDIMFMIDESNSMWGLDDDLVTIHWGFDDAKNFIAGMIAGGVSQASNIHVAKFSKSLRNVYNFTEDQSNNTIVELAVRATQYRDATAAESCVIKDKCWTDKSKYDTVSTIRKCVNKCNNPFGNTRTLDSVKYAISVFQDWNSNPKANSGKLFVLVTDGRPWPRPQQAPCSKVKELHDVVGGNVIIVGLGPKWKLDDYTKCLITPAYDYDNPDPSKVYDPTRIITVKDWSQSAFDAAGLSTGGFLCPNAFSLKLTEIHIEEWNNIYHPRFVEFYNDGATLRLAANNLKFDGFMKSIIFGLSGHAGCNITIEADTYVVFYDPSGDMPNCPGCNCTLNGNNLWCDEALYIPCDDTATTSGCGTCEWDMTMSNTNWEQSISDGVTSDVLSEATRIPSNQAYLNIAEGYSSELIAPDAVIAPQNWKMSCNYSGTPGAGMVVPCNISCVVSVCQAQGDVNATCAGATQADRCICTKANHYYLSSSSGCLFLPAPLSCDVYSRGMNEDYQAQVTEIFWSPDPNAIYSKGVYFEINYDGDTKQSYGYQTMLFRDTPAEKTIEVYAVYIDEVNGKVESDRVTCDTYTIDPSPAPTKSPTHSNANIEWCEATVEGYNIINVKWAQGEPVEPSDIQPPVGGYKYYVFGNWIEGNDNTAFKSKTTTLRQETLTSELLLDLHVNPEPEIYVVTEILIPGTNNPDTTRMETPGEGRIRCDIKTPGPTPSPTDIPSKTPSKSPTPAPTDVPTSSPTYAPWDIKQCFLDIPSINANGPTSIVITFTYNRQIDSAEDAIIHFIYGNKQKQFTPNPNGQTGDITWPSVFFISTPDEIAQLNDAINNGNGFSAYVQYTKQDQTLDTSLPKTCTFITPTPTRSPSRSPTQDPSESPSKYPSESPSKFPSKSPTQSPTFKDLTLTTCSGKISSNLRGLTVTFNEAFYDDDDATNQYPLKKDIKYLIKVGETEERESFAVAPEQEQIISFELDAGYFNIETTQITINIPTYGDSMSLPITCDLITNAPTPLPTTPEPTAFPTQQTPVVYFDIIDKESLWVFDGPCSFPDPSVRRRLENTVSVEESKGELSYTCPMCDDLSCSWCPPICSVIENTDEKYIRIIREPATFKHYIKLDVSLEFLKDSNGKSMKQQDFNSKGRDRTWKRKYADLFDSKSDPEKGKYTTIYIAGGEANAELIIPYYLTVDKNVGNDKEPTEYFQIRIHNCYVDDSEGVEEEFQVPAELKGIYGCMLDPQYPAVIIAVKQQEEDDTFISQKKGEMPMWVWYPIGFAGLAIPFVAYLIWRFYNAKKAADAMEVVRKFELGEAEKQDDVGDFGVIGDHIQANPMATGAVFEVAKEDVAVNTRLEFEKANFEVATVVAEHNIFKQDFGPVQAEKNQFK